MTSKLKLRRLAAGSLIASCALVGTFAGVASAEGPPALPAPVPGLPTEPPDQGQNPPGAPPQNPVPLPIPGGGA